MAGPDAVVLDLDGVLVDSEEAWDEARRELVAERGGEWKEGATHAMLGMSSPEWSAYVRDELGVDMAPEEISDAVVERLLAGYRRGLPLLPGAVDAVRALAARWPLGLASSSNAPVIGLVLRGVGLDAVIRAWVSARRSRAASRRPTSTSRRRGASAWSRRGASRSRTRATGCAPRPPRAWPSWRSRCAPSRPRPTRSHSPP